MAMLTARGRTAAASPWRLITTTSVPLFERVLAGAFESRLFYSLNAIHIILDTQPEGSTSRKGQAPVL
jgi:DNA-binding NtrC family response regulator